MGMIIELPDEIVAQLASVPEQDRNRYAIAALAYGLTAISAAEAEEQAWWSRLSLDEQEASRRALAQSLADFDAGRQQPADEVFARVRSNSGSRDNGAPA